MKKIKSVCILIVMFLLLYITNVYAGTIFDLGDLKIEVIKVQKYSNTGSEIKTKIINTSGKVIKSCQLTCIVYKDEDELDFWSPYVVKPGEEVKPNDKFYYKFYIFDTPIEAWNKIGFRIKHIKF